MSARTLPALRGGQLALLAAVLFGVSTPLVQQFGMGLGAFSNAVFAAGGFMAVRTTDRFMATQSNRRGSALDPDRFSDLLDRDADSSPWI